MQRKTDLRIPLQVQTIHVCCSSCEILETRRISCDCGESLMFAKIVLRQDIRRESCNFDVLECIFFLAVHNFIFQRICGLLRLFIVKKM